MFSTELQAYVNRCDELDVFSRSALQQTFILLRKVNPAMALVVQNIINSSMIDKPNELNDEHRTDSFRIQLEVYEIKQIIHSLVSLVPKIGQKKIITNLTLLGNLVVLKSLIEDWIRVANVYIYNYDALDTESTNIVSMCQ